MSGGSMDYVSFKLEEQEGCFVGDRYEDYLESLMEDFADLLHSREWYLSSDIGEGSWNEVRDNFLRKYMPDFKEGKYCKDCAKWHGTEDQSYGSCELESQFLFHRCDPICEYFKER